MATSEKSRSEDWKDKYFKVLNELDDQERDWSDQIARLSRDLIALLARFRGIDATFDRALASVSSAEVIHEDAIQTRLKALVDAVDKLADAQSTTTTGKGGSAEPAPPLLDLIDKLEVPQRLEEFVDDMRNRLSAASDKAEDLASVELLAAELSAMVVQEDAARLHEARDSVQTLIDHLSLPESAHARLSEITSKLQSAIDADTIHQIAKELSDFVVDLMSSLQAKIASIHRRHQGTRSRIGAVTQQARACTRTRHTRSVDGLAQSASL